MRLSQGNRVIRFIEQHCVLVNGAFMGKPFKLQPWQKTLLNDLFELDSTSATDPMQMLRRYRHALVGTPKKNGKTEIAAALGLYFLLGDGEPDPLVAVAAGSEQQADLVFGTARRMAALSPTLSEVTEGYDKEIFSKTAAGGKMMRVAAAVGTNDGLNISAAILDELHEWDNNRGRGVWNVLTNGTISRRQPLVFQITTAGYDKESLCYEQYELGKQVQSGEIKDKRFFFRWFEPASEKADHRLEATWKEANPSFGVTVKADRLEDEVSRKTEAVFRRYFLNQWTEAAQLWLPFGAWESLADPSLELDTELPTVAAIDAATKNDSTAVVIAQWQGEKLAVKARIWERPVDPMTGKPKEDWRLPMAELEAHIRDLHKEFTALSTIGFDPAFITWLAQQLENDGLPVEEFPQSALRMSKASQALYELIVQGQLVHDGQPDLARHIKNAAAESTGAGNGAWRLVKGKAKRKMDAAIALAMCAYLASAFKPDNYTPGLWVFDAEGNVITPDEPD
jgi:phage terminase large subunit-like protein